MEEVESAGWVAFKPTKVGTSISDLDARAVGWSDIGLFAVFEKTGTFAVEVQFRKLAMSSFYFKKQSPKKKLLV